MHPNCPVTFSIPGSVPHLSVEYAQSILRSGSYPITIVVWVDGGRAQIKHMAKILDIMGKIGEGRSILTEEKVVDSNKYFTTTIVEEQRH